MKTLVELLRSYVKPPPPLPLSVIVYCYIHGPCLVAYYIYIESIRPEQYSVAITYFCYGEINTIFVGQRS